MSAVSSTSLAASPAAQRLQVAPNIPGMRVVNWVGLKLTMLTDMYFPFFLPIKNQAWSSSRDFCQHSASAQARMAALTLMASSRHAWR